jgi:hypothetical protein
MITTCDKTGIQFEADSKRQKNHPRISAFLDEANKDSRRYVGSYAAAQQILSDIKAAGMTDISEAMSYANEACSAWKSGEAKPIIRKTAGWHIRQQKDASRQRDAINGILKQHGYRWEKDEVGSEDDFLPGSYGAGIGEFAGYVWTLYAPDGRIVGVHEAFAAIGVEMP